MTTRIKSTAARVLSTGKATEAETKSLAAYALGDDGPVQTVKSFEELQALYNKINGVEGQSERAAAIRTQMDRMAE